MESFWKPRPTEPQYLRFMTDSDVTGLLAAASRGETDAMDQLFPVVYGKLKVLARKHLRAERAEHTLGATGLVHEAYLKLVDQRDVSWESQAHFYGIAALAMRRILVDHARRRAAGKRGRQFQVTLDTDAGGAIDPTDDILGVDEALTALAREDPRAARLVDLRYFAGLTIEDAARVLDISPATAKRDWSFARAWLQRALA